MKRVSENKEENGVDYWEKTKHQKEGRKEK
jgi:hypothetical protein